MSNHSEQVSFMYERDGLDAAINYAKQSLRMYRRCAKPKPDGSKHFAHTPIFRKHYVESIIYLRYFLRNTK